MNYQELCGLNIEELKKAPCECVRCDSCHGSGTIWLDWRGRYLGNSRCDDSDEMESCDQCRGSGIIEDCDRCMMLEEFEQGQGC